jgi:hypothetical protein
VVPGYARDVRGAIASGQKANLGVYVGTPYNCEGCPVMKDRVTRANELLERVRHMSITVEAPDIVIPGDQLRDGEPAEAVEELLTIKEWIDSRYTPCRDSLGIFNSGEQVGMYCASEDEDIHFEQ